MKVTRGPGGFCLFSGGPVIRVQEETGFDLSCLQHGYPAPVAGRSLPAHSSRLLQDTTSMTVVVSLSGCALSCHSLGDT